MVDFGSEQGLSNFETGGIAGYVEDLKRAKTPLRAKRCRLWMDNSYDLNPPPIIEDPERFYRPGGAENRRTVKNTKYEYRLIL
jgi:hypothetical protein